MDPTRMKSTLFAAGSRNCVRTLASEVSAPEYPGREVRFGSICATPFAWYDQNMQLWKTWRRYAGGAWELWSGTWPRSGMIRNGIAYQLPALVPFMKGTGYGLSATPTAVMPVTRQPCQHIVLKSGRPRKVLKTGSTCSMNWAQEMLYNGLIPTPELCEFWMRYPIGHTDLNRLATASCRESQNTLGGN